MGKPSGSIVKNSREEVPEGVKEVTEEQRKELMERVAATSKDQLDAMIDLIPLRMLPKDDSGVSVIHRRSSPGGGKVTDLEADRASMEDVRGTEIDPEHSVLFEGKKTLPLYRKNMTVADGAEALASGDVESAMGAEQESQAIGADRSVDNLQNTFTLVSGARSTRAEDLLRTAGANASGVEDAEPLVRGQIEALENVDLVLSPVRREEYLNALVDAVDGAAEKMREKDALGKLDDISILSLHKIKTAADKVSTNGLDAADVLNAVEAAQKDPINRVGKNMDKPELLKRLADVASGGEADTYSDLTLKQLMVGGKAQKNPDIMKWLEGLFTDQGKNELHLTG